MAKYRLQAAWPDGKRFLILAHEDQPLRHLQQAIYAQYLKLYALTPPPIERLQDASFNDLDPDYRCGDVLETNDVVRVCCEAAVALPAYTAAPPDRKTGQKRAQSTPEPASGDAKRARTQSPAGATPPAQSRRARRANRRTADPGTVGAGAGAKTSAQSGGDPKSKAAAECAGGETTKLHGGGTGNKGSGAKADGNASAQSSNNAASTAAGPIGKSMASKGSGTPRESAEKKAGGKSSAQSAADAAVTGSSSNPTPKKAPVNPEAPQGAKHVQKKDPAIEMAPGDGQSSSNGNLHNNSGSSPTVASVASEPTRAAATESQRAQLVVPETPPPHPLRVQKGQAPQQDIQTSTVPAPAFSAQSPSLAPPLPRTQTKKPQSPTLESARDKAPTSGTDTDSSSEDDSSSDEDDSSSYSSSSYETSSDEEESRAAAASFPGSQQGPDAPVVPNRQAVQTNGDGKRATRPQEGSATDNANQTAKEPSIIRDPLQAPKQSDDSEGAAGPKYNGNELSHDISTSELSGSSDSEDSERRADHASSSSEAERNAGALASVAMKSRQRKPSVPLPAQRDLLLQGANSAVKIPTPSPDVAGLASSTVSTPPLFKSRVGLSQMARTFKPQVHESGAIKSGLPLMVMPESRNGTAGHSEKLDGKFMEEDSDSDSDSGDSDDESDSDDDTKGSAIDPSQLAGRKIAQKRKGNSMSGLLKRVSSRI